MALLSLTAATACAKAPREVPPGPCSAIDPDHAAFTAILSRFVDDKGLVDYVGLKKERRELDGYLTALQAVCPPQYTAMNREARIAFWINAYNAYTLALVLEHHPLSSIRKIGLLPSSAFRMEFIPLRAVGVKKLRSLDDLEHGILRKEFAEPRIHFAVNCASIGCPALRREAYRAAELEGQLEDMTRRFLADPTKNRFEAEANTLHLSQIFKWFAEDFEKKDGSVKAFVARYLPESTAQALGKDDVKVRYLDYDWSLNEQRR